MQVPRLRAVVPPEWFVAWIALCCLLGCNASPASDEGGPDAGDDVVQEATAHDGPPDVVEADRGDEPGPSVKAATPVFEPPAGSYPGAVSVAIESGTLGSQIYLTLDGTTPTLESITYGGPLAISTTTTVKAFALAPGRLPSELATATYSIDATGAPEFEPPSGIYAESVAVSISSPTAGATIHYSVDGTAPNAQSTTYVSPITLTATNAVRALAVHPSYQPSSVSEAIYTIQPRAEPPTIEISPPTWCESTPMWCGAQTIITARACREGMASCEVSVADYTLKAANPVLFHPPGTPTPASPPTPNFIVSSTATPARIRYYDIPIGTQAPVLDCVGSPNPGVLEVLSNNTMVYVTGGRTIGAIVCKADYLPSDVVVGEYPLPS